MRIHKGVVVPGITNQVGISEAEVEKKIRDYLNSFPCSQFWSIKNENVSKYRAIKANDGMSDLIGSYAGRFVAIEVKIKKDYLWYCSFRERISLGNFAPSSNREEHVYNQILFQEKVKRSGGIAFFTFSFDHCWKKLNEELKAGENDKS